MPCPFTAFGPLIIIFMFPYSQSLLVLEFCNYLVCVKSVISKNINRSKEKCKKGTLDKREKEKK